MEKLSLLTPIRILDVPDRALASKFGSDLQPDLLYIESILVSTGENLNDDVFLPEEMWKARSSPVFKPMDWEHNTGEEILDKVDEPGARHLVQGNQIIGVMYDAHVIGKDGSVVASDSIQVPDEFHIVNKGVVYKYLFPKVAARIVREAKAGKLFVSMEAWFKGYDYKVGNKIVARNSETAFLDSHLRSNGGTGSFKNERVGRVLRNITFGGIGFVANPANKDSIIQSFTNASSTTLVDESISGHILGELSIMKSKESITLMADTGNDMSAKAVEALEKVAELEKNLADRDAALASLKKEAEKLTATVDVFSASLAQGALAVANVIGSDVASKIEASEPTAYMSILRDAASKLADESKLAKSQLDDASKKIAALELAQLTSEITQKVAAMLEGVKSVTPELKDRIVKLACSMDASARDAYLEDTKNLLGLALKSVSEFPPKDKMEDEEKEDEEAEANVLENVKTTAAALPAGNSSQAPDLVERMKSLAGVLVMGAKTSEEE